MTFEQDIDELVSEGKYTEVKDRVASRACPLATAMKGKRLVREAAGNHLTILENMTMRATDFQKFDIIVKNLIELSECHSFPCRTKAGELAVKLYSQYLAVDEIRNLSKNRRVPKSVASKANMELMVCRKDIKFLGSLPEAGTSQTPKAAMRKC